MFNCPSCHECGITFIGKVWSGSDTPAKCYLCSSLAYVKTKDRYSLNYSWVDLLSFVVNIVLLYVSFRNEVFITIYAIPFVWLTGYIIQLPMHPITKEEAQERNKYGYIFLALFIFIVLSIGLGTNI